MDKTCNSPLTCVSHGLAWPCELCSIENISSTICQRCGQSGETEALSAGRRICAAWAHSAPVYPALKYQSVAQEPLDSGMDTHPAAAWLSRFQRLGLELDLTKGVITIAGASDSPAGSATVVRLRFGDRTHAVLCRAADAEFGKQFETSAFNAWTPEIRFDGDVLYWKELDWVERSGAPIDDDAPEASIAGSISTLCVQPWTELQSLQVDVLRTHGPMPDRSDSSAPDRGIEDGDAPEAGEREAGADERSLTILRHPDSERDTGVRIVSVEAWEKDDGAVAIVGELETISGNKLDDYRELQFTVYDEAGKILGRGYTNFSPFGRRQSFEEEIFELRSGGRPAKVRVFPSMR